MWAKNVQVVKSRISNYHINFSTTKTYESTSDYYFLKYFLDEEKVLMARKGAPISIADGRARFSHVSIQKFFAMVVLVRFISTYKLKRKDCPTLEESYLNSKLIDDNELDFV